MKYKIENKNYLKSKFLPNSDLFFYLVIATFSNGTLFSCHSKLRNYTACYAEARISEYKEVERKVLVQMLQAQTDGPPIPAKWKIVKEHVLIYVSDPKTIPILCDKDLTNHRKKKIKKALEKRGYQFKNDPPSDHELLKTLKSFQLNNGFPIGYYSFETLKELGLKFSLNLDSQGN